MKSVSFLEFDQLVDKAQTFKGAKIDNVVIDNDILVLSLRRPQGPCSLVIDVRNRVPFFILTDQNIPKLKKQIKPIVLFLKAHAMGLALVSVSRQKKYGRLIEFVFSSGERSLTLEAHLFPQGKNIKVSTAESSLCLKKPQELTEVAEGRAPAEIRSVDEIFEEWLAQFQAPSKVQKEQSGADATAAKKQASLTKLLEHKQTLVESLWPEYAHWLHQERTDVVPKKYAKFFDSEKSVVENIELAFSESKKIKAKIQSIDERIGDLEKQLQRLDAGADVASKPAKVAESPLQGVKGRTREFDDGIRAYIGKSGTDNLKLLRQSKAWYIWVHAKDWPSAHAIIAINKGQRVPPAVLKDVCLWVLKETVSEKQWQSWLGIKVDFLYTERRYLQPIKGDHHGRVRYTEAKTITLAVE